MIDVNGKMVIAMEWYKILKEERDKAGLEGREFCLLEETGISAINMGKRFIKDMNTVQIIGNRLTDTKCTRYKMSKKDRLILVTALTKHVQDMVHIHVTLFTH